MLSLRKCDLQVHSPRDPNYKGWPEDLMTLDGLKEWARQLLKRCEVLGIGCIAVTDHHDLVPGLVALGEAYALKSSVWVFPGVEVTSRSGIQAVLLLDPSAFGTPDKFDLFATEAIANKLLGVLGQDIAAGQQPSKQMKVTPLKELEALKSLPKDKRHDFFVSRQADRVNREFDGPGSIAGHLESLFKDKYLLLPNLEKESQHGVFGNPAGRPLYFDAEGWFVGGILDGAKATNEDAIAGKLLKDFGKRVVAVARTSDQRGKDASDWFSPRLGKDDCVCWAEVSEHTTTSLTQAFISGTGRRLFAAKPEQPTDHLESLTISGAEIFGSKPLHIAFAPNLNTLIGGRGSGKSLIISALLRVFSQDAEWRDKDPTLLPAWEERHLSLFDADGPFGSNEVSIVVQYTKDSGVRYRLTMDSPGVSVLKHLALEMWSGKSWTPVAKGDSVAASLEFYPLFFLQGQMSAITGSAADQSDLIGLIEGPVREERRTLRGKLDRLATAAREGIHEQLLLSKHGVRRAELAALIKQKDGERLAFLNAAKKGLTEEQQKLFADAEVLRKGKQALDDLDTSLQQALDSLGEVREDLDAAIKGSAPDVKGLQGAAFAGVSDHAYVTQTIEASKRLENAIGAAIKRVETDQTAVAGQRKGFESKFDGLLEKAKAVATQEKNRREAIVKAGNLEKEIAGLRKQDAAAEQAAQKATRSGKIKAGQEALAEFKETVKAYSEMLQKRAEAISQSDESRLVVKLIPGGDYQPVLDAMKQTCGGCGIKATTWASLDDALTKASSPAARLTDLISSMLSAFANPAAASLPDVWKGCGFSPIIFSNMLEKTTIESWSQLSVTLADDRVDVRYLKGPGKAPIPIRNASPGERAVELLKVALFATHGPLVIDQPEDDLDNHFLADKLVELVHKSKHRNQLVFASHNANLVVHGDSEVIQVMNATDAGGKMACELQLTGTIDQTSVCSEVERVMEGGRLAFERRRQKYHETLDPLLADIV